MRFRSAFAAVAMTVALICIPAARAQTLGEPNGLTVDLAGDLMGMDDPAPGFAWKLVAARADVRGASQWKLVAARADVRGASQSAYQLRLATSPDALTQGRPDMWDSGRVVSAEQIGIGYAGKKLASTRSYWWQVRAWDGDGRPSPWSKPARFVTGFMKPADWSDHAHWIAAPQPRAGLAGAAFVWRDGVGPAHFRKTITLPALRGGTAIASVAATGAFTMLVNGRPVSVRATTGAVADLDLLPYLRADTNVIDVQVRPDAGTKQHGMSLRAEMRGADGRLVLLTTGADWSAKRDGGAWRPATRIAGFGEAPFVDYLWRGGTVNDRPPLMRKSFAVKRCVQEALLFVSGLGVYDATLNGRPVGNDVVPPAWTDYGKAVPYRTYDVTKLIADGGNVLAMRLGNGWFDYQSETLIDRKGLGEHVPVLRHWGVMRLRAQLRLRYDDGTVEDVTSDESWKTAEGPHAMAHVFGSEMYDARRERRGWTGVGFDDRGWRNAVEIEAPPGRSMAQIAPTTVVRESYSGRTMPPKPAIGPVIDFGTNMNGRYRVRLVGAAGQEVRIVPGEVLNPDGSVKPTDSNGRATFSLCTLSGGEDVCSLDFSTAGFRYLSLASTKAIRIVSAEADAVSADAPETGRFTTSDPRYDAIYRMAVNTLLSNMMTAKTDCPTYEKLGWGEVLTTLAPSYTYIGDVSRLFRQFAVNNRDAQRADGQIPNIVPGYTRANEEYDQAPAWGAQMFTVPWTLYRTYGDKRVLVENYPAMQRYVAFLRTIENKDGIVTGGLGDWMSTAGTMPRNVETAFYAHDLKLMAEIATALGKTQDARHYTAEATRVAAAYNRAFYDRAAGRYEPASQGAQALPLALELVAPADEAAVGRALIDTIRHPALKPDRDGLFGPILPDHIAAGDIATTYIWRALGDMRRSDLVDRMILQPTMPSYWNMVANGLTAIPEAWNYPISRSWNHDMYAGIVEWFYRNVGGIAPTSPGYATVTIAPVPPPGMSHAEVRYGSIRGPVVSNWRREGKRFILDVQMPPNSRAEVLLPVPATARTTESGHPITGAQAVEGGIKIAIGSGRYHFVAQEE